MGVRYLSGVSHPTQDLTVDAAVVETSADLVELRGSDWHGGALRILRYPSKVVGFIGTEPPLAFGGVSFEAPAAVLRGPAGDLEAVDVKAVS